MTNPFSSQENIPSEYPLVSHETVTQEWCKLHRLIEELSLIQRRLGTPLETNDDYIAVRELGHQIRNKLHLVQLWTELGLVAPSDFPLELTAS